MKYLARDPDSSGLSNKALSSSLIMFLGRVALALLALPLSGYLLGSIADRRWPGQIPWAIALALLGLTAGLIHLWMWMKRPAP